MLFSTNIPEQEDKKSGACISDKTLHQVAASRKLDDIIQDLDDYPNVHWVTEGEWSMHEMLVMLLEKTGPARVCISSYAFSDFPARVIANLVSREVITELYCILDSRIDTRSAGSLNIVRNAATFHKLCQTHAKVTVIEGRDRSYCCVGSANYTVNKRYEAGIVSRQVDIIDFHKNWIMNECKKNT